MSRILILYSTTDGHTRKISQRLEQIVVEHNHQVDLRSIDEQPQVSLEPFDKIVIGASIRYGKHRPQVQAFIKQHESTLDSKPNAFFSVNLVARKPGRNHPDTNPYVKKFLRHISWQPKNIAIFAGKLDYPKYDFWDRNIIRLIMWMTRGPTDPGTVMEFTDWKQVDEFGQLIADM